MNIDYESMKELMKLLDKYDINYSFGNYYSPDGSDVIVGHWLEINADLHTDEIDNTDKEYNNN